MKTVTTTPGAASARRCHHQRVRIATVAALAGTLAACVLAPAPVTPVDPASATTQPQDEGCKNKPRIVCGHVTVPLDRHDPVEGTLDVTYQVLPSRGETRGTILATEGGPGYSSISSTRWYRDLFHPMLEHRQLLIVDLRGTGASGAINCPQLQAYAGDYVTAVGRCGRRLGSTSDLYGSRLAALDVVAVLDHLGIEQVDYYGDSYGTYFGQVLAVNHPDRVRSLVLDAAYWVGGTDPYWPDSNVALRQAFTLACRRDVVCAQHPGAPMQRVRRLVERVRHQPITGRAPNADGEVRRVTVDVNAVVTMLTAGSGNPTVYREVDAAIRAALREHPYLLPLLRLARETTYEGGAGDYRVYSEGLFLAVSCNDYAQPFDISAPIAERPAQYERSLRRLERRTPRVFRPFTVREWTGSEFGYFDSCLRWPAPSRWVPPIPADADYPDVPVLVLAGDLDSNTSSGTARDTAAAFPRSTFVQVHNTGHISALEDFDQCASLIVRRFVRSLDAGDTSCAQERRPWRLVDRFSRTVSALPGAGPRARTARAAAAAAADVQARWYGMYGYAGVGLRGGTFRWSGGSFSAPHPVVRWQLDAVRVVRGVAVSGTIRWHRRTGDVTARLRVSGRGASPGRLLLRWNDGEQRPVAHVSGRLAGQPVRFRFAAP